jgi:hypothetical protein
LKSRVGNLAETDRADLEDELVPIGANRRDRERWQWEFLMGNSFIRDRDREVFPPQRCKRGKVLPNG